MEGSSAKELRDAYNVSTNTWTVWIKPLIKEKIIKPYTKIYTPKQVQAIKNLLGEP